LGFLLLLLFIKINAQKKLNVSVGSGASFNKIISEQFILFYKIPKLEGEIINISYEEDFAAEFISVNNKLTYVIGPGTMLHYSIALLSTNISVKAGIGLNYVSNTEIANRNLGGHFIFSDMISIGYSIINSKNFSLGIGYLLRHISNAGLYQHNDGFTSQYLLININI
jgi:hypothetical protein